MFRIVSDIGADIPKELKTQITVIHQEVSINEENIVVREDEKDFVDFYTMIDSAKNYRTRALTVNEIKSVLEKEHNYGDILCFSFSQRLSATGYQMEKACNDMNFEHNKILYYDTQTATVGQGVLIYLAMLCRDNGFSMEETIANINKYKNKLKFYVILDKSTHFFSGGRAENLLEKSSYYPVLYLPLGELYQCIGYTLNRRAAIKFLEEKISKKSNKVIFIGHGNNKAEAEKLKQKWSCYAETIGTCFANPVMGVHTGDKALLVAILEN